MKDLIINFCPTGMVPTKLDNPSIPVTINEIIEQTQSAYEKGITIVHLHARDERQIPTYKSNVYFKIFEGIRRYCPDLLISASASGRNVSEFEKRSEVIELKPDMCSLTLSSLNFINQTSTNEPTMIWRLAEKMYQYGVVPELEAFDLGMINYGKYLIKKNILKAPFYWNLLFGNIAGWQGNLNQISAAIAEIPKNHFIALAGLGDQQLKVNATAIANGYGVRVGLEDNIWWDNKNGVHATNKILLNRIHDLANIHGRRIISGQVLKQKWKE
jgi:uncharacterized protein (DUF849 family)